MQNLKELIYGLPKAELHVHLEGTMEPEQFMLFAERNKITIPYKTIEEAEQAYNFSDFRSFINAYSKITEVLCTEEDFYDLALAYLKKASSQGVLHTEISFGFQEYVQRNISPASIVNGIHQAILDAKILFNISAELILCFIRTLSPKNAFDQLTLSLPFKDKIIGVGLASIEEGNPASKFEKVFSKAATYGYHLVAHAGECNVENIRETIELLHVERIDHGIQAIADPSLIAELSQKQIPLTVCPLSNVALGIVKNLAEHPLKKLFYAGIMVTINSDDPAFFNGYIAENYYAAITEMGLSLADIIQCARNSFLASFASNARKKECLERLNSYVRSMNIETIR